MVRSDENKEFAFRVLWGMMEVRSGKDHPNIVPSFNSYAVIESATARVSDATPGILIRASHPDFEGGILGSVFIDGGRVRAKELAEFVSERKGNTVEQVAAEIRALGLFS